MPIRKDRRHLYPKRAEWAEIRERTLVRAKFRCEGSPRFPNCRAENGQPHPVTGSQVVLTCAHMDHDPRNSEPGNIRALCNRCHCDWDRMHHAATRRRPALEAENLALEV